MHFCSFEIKNLGPFRSFASELARGTVGIFGKNGAGKSTLCNLLYGAVVNDFKSRFAGDKGDRIFTGSGARDQSYIQVSFEHGGHVFDLTRGFRSPGHRLKVDGGKAITDSNKIKDELDRLLVPDRRTLDLFVFKAQDRIYDFISMERSVRSKMFQTLCHTEGCEAIWDMIGVSLRELAAASAAQTDDQDVLAARVETLQSQLDRTTDEHESLRSRRLSNKKKLQHETKLANRVKYLDYRREFKRLERRVPKLEARASLSAKRLYVVRRKLSRLKKELAARVDETQAAKRALEDWDVAETRATRLDQLASVLQALTAEERSHVVPKEPKADFDEGDLAAQSISLEKDLDAAKKIVKAVASAKAAKCPVCGSSLDPKNTHVKAQQVIVDTYPGKLQLLIDRMETHRERTVAWQAHLKWANDHTNRRKAAEIEQKNLIATTPKIPKGNRADVRSFVKITQKLEEDIQVVSARSDRTFKKNTKNQEAMTSAQESLEALGGKMGKVRVSKTAAGVSEAALADDRKLADKMSQLSGQLKAEDRSLDEAKENLRAAQRKAARSTRSQEMVEVLKRAYAVIHRNQLPKDVAQSNLAHMEGDINTRLELLGKPFWIETRADEEAKDDLMFTVHRPGLPAHPADWLSAGQRVILAVAFWLAVAGLSKSDIGMLVLDEPTANLDAANREHLADACGQLTVTARGRLQVLIVSHADNLRNQFEQVLDLDVV